MMEELSNRTEVLQNETGSQQSVTHEQEINLNQSEAHEKRNQPEQVFSELFFFCVIDPLLFVICLNPISFTLWTLFVPKKTATWVRKGFWTSFPGVDTLVKGIAWCPKCYPWFMKKHFVEDNPRKWCVDDQMRCLSGIKTEEEILKFVRKLNMAILETFLFKNQKDFEVVIASGATINNEMFYTLIQEGRIDLCKKYLENHSWSQKKQARMIGSMNPELLEYWQKNSLTETTLRSVLAYATKYHHPSDLANFILDVIKSDMDNRKDLSISLIHLIGDFLVGGSPDGDNAQDDRLLANVLETYISKNEVSLELIKAVEDRPIIVKTLMQVLVTNCYSINFEMIEILLKTKVDVACKEKFIRNILSSFDDKMKNLPLYQEQERAEIKKQVLYLHKLFFENTGSVLYDYVEEYGADEEFINLVYERCPKDVICKFDVAIKNYGYCQILSNSSELGELENLLNEDPDFNLSAGVQKHFKKEQYDRYSKLGRKLLPEVIEAFLLGENNVEILEMMIERKEDLSSQKIQNIIYLDERLRSVWLQNWTITRKWDNSSTEI